MTAHIVNRWRGRRQTARVRGNLSRLTLSTLVAGLVTVAAFAAIAGASGTSGGVSLACKNGFITIGIAKAHSGGSSFSDVAGTRGTKIAIDQVNASGGIKGCKLKTIEGDTKSDPVTAGQVARQLISRGAQILIVPDDFDLGLAAARAGEKAGLLTLSLAASSTQFGKAVGNLFFNAGPTTTQLAQAQAAFALTQHGLRANYLKAAWKTAYMVVDPGLAYFTEQGSVFRKAFAAGGGKVVGEDKVDSLGGASDYSSTVTKIKNMSPAPKVIDAQMAFSPIGSFVKELRAAGINTPVLG